jgi:cytochrome c1
MHRALISSAVGLSLVACSAPPPSATPISIAQPADTGTRLFVTSGCGGCHTLAGVPTATGLAGPNLTNVSLRPTLAGETVPNDPATLERFLLDPRSVKADARMPNVGLTASEARELADFLMRQPNQRR